VKLKEQWYFDAKFFGPSEEKKRLSNREKTFEIRD
jgi:hypothetical protein